MKHDPETGNTIHWADVDRYKAITELMSDGIVIATPQGRFLEVNPAICAMLGYTSSEILQLSWQDIILDKALEAGMILMEDLAPDEHVSIKRQLCTKDTQELEVEIRTRKLSNGSLLSIVCRTTTHTLQKTDSALVISEERYRLLAENSLDVIWVLNLTTGRFRYVSPSIERVRGYSVAEALSERMEDALTPESMTYIAQVTPDRITDFYAGNKRSYTDQLEQPCKDGTTRWFEVISHFVINGSTGHLEVYGSSRDISARRQAEIALRASETRLRLAQRCAHLGYIVIDARTGQVFWSEQTFEILGYEPYTFTPSRQHLLDRIHPEDTKQIYLDIEQLITQNQASQREYRIILPNGRVGWIYGRIEAFLDSYGQTIQYIGILQDITERKQAEEALLAERAQLAERVAEQTADLRIANAELSRAARLKDEFLANMSHELRTPLNAVLGRTEMLKEGIYGSLTPRQVEALDNIETSGRHLLELINDILDLSKIEAGKLDLQITPIDINLLCQTSMQMITQNARMKQIVLNRTIDYQVDRFLADERRLKQILVNLLSNAVKFTPEGGSVGLEIHGNPTHHTLTFSVWDTGIGIAADDITQLFKPFTQIDSGLNRQYNGTGLGLALVQRLTIAQGGSITVESEPGKGSRFNIVIPWKVAIAPALVENTETTSLPPPQLNRVLVIDDSHLATEQITHYLSELGIQVEVHMQANGAIERAVELQPDVIVLDILLPDQPGWAVLRQLKADPRTQTIPVIIVSIIDQPDYSHTLGAAAHIAKPINRITLIDELHKIFTTTREAYGRTALVIVPQTDEQRPHLRILLTEDNDEQSQIVSEYLRRYNYEVIIAHNGRDALTLSQQGPLAAVIMDIQMPDMDGLETIRHLRADDALRTVPIIALTALAMPGDRERCLEAGANVYLTKPISLKLLMQSINSQIQLHSS
ncbi:MAG: PAS domain S-box protein [Oscillochloris sp.]|nr:PAS domain S-box protein [Oscillochloris sp.]